MASMDRRGRRGWTGVSGVRMRFGDGVMVADDELNNNVTQSVHVIVARQRLGWIKIPYADWLYQVLDRCSLLLRRDR